MKIRPQIFEDQIAFESKNPLTPDSKSRSGTRSRSHDHRQKHIFKYPSFEPPIYILDGETIDEYYARVRMTATEVGKNNPNNL